MILGIDLGNSNIKTSEEVIFSSNFTKAEDYDPLGKGTIEFNGQKYLLERGLFDNEFNKAKKDYLPNLLYAIANSVPNVNPISVDLALGVPVDNLGISEKLRSDLSDNEYQVLVDNKTYRTIKINRIAVIGEGIAAYYTIPKEERKDDIMLIDIGGRTSNVVCYKKGKLVNKFTVPEGILNLFDKVRTKENNLNGENYTVEIVEEYVNKGIIKNIDTEKRDLIDDLFNAINFKDDMRAYKLWFSGGGTITLGDTLKGVRKDVSVVESPLFANAKGNKKIAQTKWGAR